MNIRHKFGITLKEEDELVSELTKAFREQFEQNAKKNFSDAITKMLATDYDAMRPGDEFTVYYDQSFTIGAIQMMINNIRSEKDQENQIQRR